MSDRLRFGIIGCGAIALESHFPAVVKSRKAQLAAALDLDPTWARATAKRFGAIFAGTRYQDLPGRIDAAIVATPNSSHAEISRYLLENGVHVLCEKPMATTAGEARSMLAAERSGTARLMIGQSLRFTPQMQFLRKILAGGFMAREGTLSISLGNVYGSWRPRTDFRLKPELSGGGVMMDLGAHLIDLALWLFEDRPEDVEYSQSISPGWSVEDDAEVKLTFSRGGRALLAASYRQEMNGLLEYSGSDGWVKTGVQGGDLDFYLGRSRGCRAAGVQQPVLDSTDPYIAQLEHFCTLLRSGGPFLVQTDQVILGLEIIKACYARNGRFSMDET